MQASRSAHRLSPRLEAVLEEIGTCALLVDLCADHAQLSLAAVARGQARRAIAIELREAPLLQARRSQRESGVQDRVLLVRGDRLALLRKIDALAIAGVGGDLAAQLLLDSPDVAHASRVVVQPNRHSREVRAWAHGNGFHIVAERVIAEGRRLHLVLAFARRAGVDPAYGAHALEAELELGPLLLASEQVTARAHLRRELRRMRALAERRTDLAAALGALERRFT